MNKEFFIKTKLKNNMELILRIPEKNDAKIMLEYLNIVGGESDNLLFGTNEMILTIDQEQAFIESVNNDANSIMIVGFIDNTLVTIANLSCPKRKRIMHNAELAISVKKEYWHMGIGSIVIKSLINYAIDHQVIKNINLGVKADNVNAIKLYEKCGFKQVGVYKNHMYINGTYYDKIIMEINLDNYIN